MWIIRRVPSFVSLNIIMKSSRENSYNKKIVCETKEIKMSNEIEVNYSDTKNNKINFR